MLTLTEPTRLAFVEALKESIFAPVQDFNEYLVDIENGMDEKEAEEKLIKASKKRMAEAFLKLSGYMKTHEKMFEIIKAHSEYK